MQRSKYNAEKNFRPKHTTRKIHFSVMSNTFDLNGCPITAERAASIYQNLDAEFSVAALSELLRLSFAYNESSEVES